MKAYFDIDENGRVVGYGSSPISDNDVELEFPEDHAIWKSPLGYVVDGEEVVEDAEYVEQLAKFEEELDNKKSVSEEVAGLKSLSSALIGGEQADEITAAKQLNKALCMFANTLPEEDALVIASIFPEWDLGVKYKKDEYVKYGVNADGEPQIYRVIQGHDSQYAWAPDKAVSLFVKVGFTDDGTSVWIQPMGAHDAYAEGDIVSYNGKLYVSTANGNVWAPDVYGWILKPEGAGTAASTKKV